MSKFKVGDRVTCIEKFCGVEKGFNGTVKAVVNGVVGVEWDKNVNGHDGEQDYSGREGFCWNIIDNLVELIALPKILITTDGVTTLARLYEGEKVVKKAEAKCSADDTFDFMEGAKLAFDRITGRED